MKKWLAIVLALLCAVAVTIPATADDPTPTPTATPDPAMLPMSVTMQIGSNVSNIDDGLLQCKTIEGDLFYLFTKTTITFESRDVTCLGEITWSIYHGYGGTHESSGTMTVRFTSATGTIYYDSDFQYSVGDDISSSDMTVGTGEATGSVMIGGSARTPNEIAETTYLYLHVTVITPCEEQWESTGTVGTGAIAATNETGMAQTLTPGQEYKLTVWGGPWNDGTDDRYDTAVKIDGGTWQALDQFAIDPNQMDCTEADPLDPTKTIIVFLATAADWKIRVNDLAGQFADNTGSMTYKLETVQPITPQGCDNQYLRGTLVTSGTIPATALNGVHPNFGPPPSPYVAGMWIEIVTSGGPWLDGGAGENRYDIAMKNPDATWSALGSSTYSACVTADGSYGHFFVQLFSNNGIDLRVNDTGGVWGNNTGSMGYSIYASTYSPVYPIGCASQYTIGSLIKSVEAFGNSKTGTRVGSLFNSQDVTGGEEALSFPEYYAIVTDGLWFNGSTPEPWGAMAATDSTPTDADWHNLQTFPEVVCAVPLDPVGHLIVFIPAGPNANRYVVRAQDYAGNWGDNNGYMYFKFYAASGLRPIDYTPGPMPGPGLCDAYYTAGTVKSTLRLYGSDEEAKYLPVLTSGRIYAIETSGGPWENNSVASYEVEISDGTTAWNLSAFEHAACAQSADGTHILVYFQALAGRRYSLRVYDPGGNFADNTDDIDVKFYDNVTIPVINNCGNNYTLTEIPVADNRIPRNPSSIAINNIEIGSGKTYAIEILDGEYWWYLEYPDEHRYEAQISVDNGSNWVDFNQSFNGACTIQLNKPTYAYERRYRIYFTAPSSGKVAMRVEGLLADGHLTFKLYGTTSLYVPPGTPPVVVPPSWLAACIDKYPRPGYLFKSVSYTLPSISFGSLGTITFPAVNLYIPAIDDWISYLEWTVRSYFAWCPEHTAVLSALPTTLDAYEPFGTFTEVTTSIDHINTLVDEFSASGGESASTYAPYSVIFSSGGGESGGASWQGILPPLNSDSPWAWSGGRLETNIGTDVDFSLEPGEGGESDYVDYCQNIFDAHMGAAVSSAMCSFVNLARSAPVIWILIQLAADIGSIWGMVNYLRKGWINPRMAG